MRWQGGAEHWQPIHTHKCSLSLSHTLSQLVVAWDGFSQGSGLSCPPSTLRQGRCLSTSHDQEGGDGCAVSFMVICLETSLCSGTFANLPWNTWGTSSSALVPTNPSPAAASPNLSIPRKRIGDERRGAVRTPEEQHRLWSCHYCLTQILAMASH